jgi:hypothetical protein
VVEWHCFSTKGINAVAEARDSCKSNYGHLTHVVGGREASTASPGPDVEGTGIRGTRMVKIWLSRNSRENRTSFRGRPNISNGLARRESEF